MHSIKHGWDPCPAASKTKQSGKLCLCKPLQYSRLGDPLAWTELCSVCIPTCMSLPRCCFRAPLVGQVMRINLLLHFICGFVVVPASCLCQLTQEAKPRIVIINNHNTTCASSSCSSTFLLHSWAACWYILKPSLFCLKETENCGYVLCNIAL